MTDLVFSIGEVATMLELSPHTIRAWQRRHGSPEPKRTASGQRRYSVEDITILRRVKDHLAAHPGSVRLAFAIVTGGFDQTAIGAFHLGPAAQSQADGGIWRAAVDLDPRPMIMLDIEGRIADCNVAFARVAGQIRPRLRGIRFSELVEPYDRSKATRIWRAPLRPHTGWEINLRTDAVQGMFSFESWPVQHLGSWWISAVAYDLGDTGAELFTDRPRS